MGSAPWRRDTCDYHRHRHHRQLYRLAVLTSRDPDDAADALQDALEALGAGAVTLTDGADQPHVPHVAEDVISFLRTVVDSDAQSWRASR